MKAITIITVCAVAAFVASVSFDTPAEAKKVNVSKNVGKKFGKSMRKAGNSISRSVRKAGNGISRSVRWGVNGLWVGTGLAAGAARATNNCNYYHRRYRETGNPKWRNKYNNCIH